MGGRVQLPSILRGIGFWPLKDESMRLLGGKLATKEGKVISLLSAKPSQEEGQATWSNIHDECPLAAF